MFVLGGLEDHIAMLPYGTQLRECRRMLRSELNKSKLENYNRIQESATARLVLALLSTPERFYDRIEWYTASFVLKMVYGYETQEEDDPMIYAAHHGLAMANKASEPGYLIELIPWCASLFIDPSIGIGTETRLYSTLRPQLVPVCRIPQNGIQIEKRPHQNA